MIELSATQRQLIFFAQGYIKRYQCFPTLRASCLGMGWRITSTHGIRRLYQLLERKGVLELWHDDYGCKGWRFTGRE